MHRAVETSLRLLAIPAHLHQPLLRLAEDLEADLTFPENWQRDMDGNLAAGGTLARQTAALILTTLSDHLGNHPLGIELRAALDRC